LAKSAFQVPDILKSSPQPVENFSAQQELQIVPNHFDHEDEPSVLAATPCLPTKSTGNGTHSSEETKEELSSPRTVHTHLLKGNRVVSA